MAEVQAISFLPAFEDYSNQINSLFVAHVLSGVNFSHVYSCPLKIDDYDTTIQTSTNAYLGPISVKMTQMGPVADIKREFSTSLLVNLHKFGYTSIQFENDSLTFQILGAPSPFLIGSFKCVGNMNEFGGLISINARQQISNINARFIMKKFEKPVFSEATAMFGMNKKAAVGFRFQYGQGTENNMYQILGRISTHRVHFQGDISFENLKKDFITGFAVKKKVMSGINIGAQLKLSKQLQKEINIGWDMKIGKNRIKSLASSRKIVSSSFARKISDELMLEISTALDIPNKDAILGFNFTWITK